MPEINCYSFYTKLHGTALRNKRAKEALKWCDSMKDGQFWCSGWLIRSALECNNICYLFDFSLFILVGTPAALVFVLFKKY